MTDKRKYCAGCRNDFYNSGNNELGIAECWCLKDAKVGKYRMVHINDVPPWTGKPVSTLSCYSRPQWIKVDPKVTR